MHEAKKEQLLMMMWLVGGVVTDTHTKVKGGGPKAGLRPSLARCLCVGCDA